MKHSGTRARRDRPTEHGVHLDVLGRALIAQADERVAWHRQMAKTLTGELKSMPLKSDEAGKTGDWKQQSRRTDLERKISGHLEYARFLTFVRQSLVRNRRYRLSLTDLTVLEISPKGLYL